MEAPDEIPTEEARLQIPYGLEIFTEETLLQIPPGPGVNVWEHIPDELFCEIIRRIPDLDTILNYVKTSKKFAMMAQQCIQSLNSTRLQEVAITLLTGFYNLQAIGDNVLLVMGEEHLPILRTMPQLRVANFRIQIAFAPNLIRKLYNSLNFNQKAPQVNFRVIDVNGDALYLQGNRVMFLSNGIVDQATGTRRNKFPDTSYVVKLVQHIPMFPVVYVDIYNLRHGPLPRYVTLARTLMRFLKEADFGLINPRSRPSQDNPPLSLSLQPLIDSGIITSKLLNGLIRLHIYYHKLVRTVDGQDYVIPDDLMNHYFRNIISRFNRSSPVIAGTLPAIIPDLISLKSLIDVIFTYMTNHPINQFDLMEYDIPTILPKEEYERTSAIISATRRLYIPQADGALTVLYRSDGSIQKY